MTTEEVQKEIEFNQNELDNLKKNIAQKDSDHRQFLDISFAKANRLQGIIETLKRFLPSE